MAQIKLYTKEGLKYLTIKFLQTWNQGNYKGQITAEGNKTDG